MTSRLRKLKLRPDMYALIAVLLLCLLPSAYTVWAPLAVGALLLQKDEPGSPGFDRPTMALLVWFFLNAAVGVCLSEYPAMAFWGHWGRNEGLLTWILIAITAIFYWRRFDSLWPLAVPLCAFYLVMVVYAIVNRTSTPIIAPTALAGLSAVAVAVFAVHCPSLAIYMSLGLITGGSRSGLLGAFVGALVGWAVVWDYRQCKEAARGLVALTLVLLAVSVFVPSIRQKFSNTNFSFDGARVHWLRQGLWQVSGIYPWGQGLDTQSQYLTHRTLDSYLEANRISGRIAPKIADRSHFFPIDIIMQTGWIGFALVLALFARAIFLLKQSSSMAPMLDCENDPWPVHRQNAACLAGLVAWITMGMVNPQGIPANLLVLICLLGLRK